MCRLNYAVLLLFYVLLDYSLIADVKNLTTNDVDFVFSGMNEFPRPYLVRRCIEAGLTSTNRLPDGIRQYAFDKLLAIPVTTNTVRFWLFYDKKAEYIERSEWMLGIHINDDALRRIIRSAADIQLYCTNNLAVMGKQARCLYEKTYPQKARFYVNGMRREFIDEWIWHRD